MSSLGGASSFALIAFSSFLTLLISHLAVQQHSSPVIQRSSSTILAGSLTPPISAPVPPPPPPLPSPPSRQHELQPPLQQPIQPSFTIESTSSPSLNLLTLVSLLLFFGLAGLWLDSPNISRSRRRNSHRQADGRRYQGSTRRLSTSSSRGNSHDYYDDDDDDDDDDDSSPRGEYTKNFPGSWKMDERKWKGKMNEGVHKMKKKLGLGEEREAEGYQLGFANRDKAEVKKSHDPLRCCKDCHSHSQEKPGYSADSKEGGVNIEQAWSAQIGSSTINPERKEAVSNSLLPPHETQTTASAARESEIKTKSVTVESVQDSPSTTAYKVAGDRTATPSSIANAQSPQGKGKGKSKEKEKEKQVTQEAVESYAEPPVAMPEVAGSSIEPLSDDILAELDKKAAKDDQIQKQVKATDQTVVKKVEEQASKGKGKQKENQKAEEQTNSTISDAQSVTSIESGKEKGMLRKGFETLSNIAKEVKDDVINEVLKELDHNKEASSKNKGKGTGKGKDEGIKDAKNVEEKEKGKQEEPPSKDKKEEEKQNQKEEKVPSKENDTSESKKKDKGSKGATTEAKTDENSNDGKKEKVTTTIIVEQTAKTKESVSSTKPVKEVEGDAEASSSQKKKNQKQNENKSEVEKSKGEVTATAKVELQAKGKEKAMEETIDSGCKTKERSAHQLTSSAGSNLTLYQQALLQGLLTTGSKTSLYHQTADYLCDLYPSLVKDTSKDVNKSLDVDFVTASKKADIPVTLPISPSESTKGSKDAARRALDLYQLYKDTYMKGDADKKATNIESQEVLQTLITALVETKQDDVAKVESNNGSTSHGRSLASSHLTSSPPSSTGYPDVIPLEEVNQSSLVKAGVWVKQQQNEKASQINEALKSLSVDVNKNIQYIKEDVGQVKEGASSKVKTLKSLLKRRGNTDQEEKKKPRKSVRLQDAAGRGEGPRDEARGETEQEARYRRLKEMANRLNE